LFDEGLHGVRLYQILAELLTLPLKGEGNLLCKNLCESDFPLLPEEFPMSPSRHHKGMKMMCCLTRGLSPLLLGAGDVPSPRSRGLFSEEG
jgi:hypothetical protein